MASTEGSPTKTKFTKQQLISAERFADRKALLCALLVDGKQYTIAAAERAIDNFMKGKVKK